VDIVLPGLALILLLAAGYGALRWLARPAGAFDGVETMSLSLLLGMGVVSLLLFSLSVLAPTAPSRIVVSLVCVALLASRLPRMWPSSMHTAPGVLCAWRRSLGSHPWCSTIAAVLLAIVVVQVGIVVWLAPQRPLAWDGLLVWEIKARFACLNGGLMPLSYFTDVSRTWTQQDYPLLVPMIEAWFYSWLGRCDQQAAKLVFPLFYLAAIGMLYAGGRRLGGSPVHGLAAAVLLFFVPRAVAGEGSVLSGYADFPLAVFYLAAAICLLAFLQTGDRRAIGPLGVLAALTPWVKQEGIILYGCLLLVVAVHAVRLRNVRLGLWALVPGLLLFGAWRIFLRASGSIAGTAFLSPTPATLLQNLPRLPEIVAYTLGELMNLSHWGILWPALIVSLLLIRRPSLLLRATLVGLIVIPLALEQGIYVFSAWVPFMSHVESSMTRLVLQVVPLAVLVLGLAVPAVSWGSPASNCPTDCAKNA
jgi:hypothetical protein